MMLHVRTFVRRFEVAESAHELLVLEVDVVEVEGEVPLREGLEVAQAARNHLGQAGALDSRSTEYFWELFTNCLFEVSDRN